MSLSHQQVLETCSVMSLAATSGGVMGFVCCYQSLLTEMINTACRSLRSVWSYNQPPVTQAEPFTEEVMFSFLQVIWSFSVSLEDKATGDRMKWNLNVESYALQLVWLSRCGIKRCLISWLAAVTCWTREASKMFLHLTKKYFYFIQWSLYWLNKYLRCHLVDVVTFGQTKASFVPLLPVLVLW